MNYTFNVFRGSESGKIVPDQITQSLKSDEVLLNMKCASLCGTDELYVFSRQVLGHEGIGIIEEVGPAVHRWKVGDRVGVCYNQRVCGKCQECLSGWDQYCPDLQAYGRHEINQGTLGTKAVWSAGSLIPIPESYGSVDATAMICGGATSWNILTRYGIRPGQRVGVIGMGGMGHIAIKLSAQLGYHTVVFSRTNSKEQDAVQFGANEFHVWDPNRNTSEPGSPDCSLKDIRPVDHLLLCCSVTADFNKLMPLMATHGTIYVLTASIEPASVALLPLVDRGISIRGSLTASNAAFKGLLKFCARHKIYPQTEVFASDQDGIQTAFDFLRGGTVRYKCVLKSCE